MSKPSRPNLYLLFFFSFAAFAFLCGLGVWQLQRLEWKQGLIARIDARVQLPPLSLMEVSGVWNDTKDVEYFPVQLTGRFLHDRERHIYALENGKTGWQIFTPFVTHTGTILINRGFVADRFKAASTRREGQIEDSIAITGLMRETGIQSRFVPDNDVTANIWYWRDLRGMSFSSGIAETDILPFYVDMDAPSPPGAMPRPGTTRLRISNNHLSYALTWFVLAGVMIVIVALFVRKSRRENHDTA